MKLRIFYDNTTYRFRGWEKMKAVVDAIIKSEKKIAGEISFIITSDNYLRTINREFLNHDYFTDVITFDYSTDHKVNGEIYISEDTVRLNAEAYNVDVDNEMLRVMLHGVLHLAGHNDKTKSQQQVMRQLEDRWANIFNPPSKPDEVFK
ncbi:MAG: rRNA maturation RNase YbeY [Bacteroidales bacterium]|nr:rRNA maturation RNase YbeY [Bacteroidales bacterium]